MDYHTPSPNRRNSTAEQKPPCMHQVSYMRLASDSGPHVHHNGDQFLSATGFLSPQSLQSSGVWSNNAWSNGSTSTTSLNGHMSSLSSLTNQLEMEHLQSTSESLNNADQTMQLLTVKEYDLNDNIDCAFYDRYT
jgi:hypothetical protein